MPYTEEDARRDVGASIDWEVGFRVSIKKWEQIVGGDGISYGRMAHCGICFVATNRNIRCFNCPAYSICDSFANCDDKEILQALKNLREEVNEMDCRNCANFKPKQESPFPQGLKTADLKMGMVVTCGNGAVYTILEAPKGKWLKVFCAYPRYTPREDTISLADHGCQPYESGAWNPRNWLREVK